MNIIRQAGGEDPHTVRATHVLASWCPPFI